MFNVDSILSLFSFVVKQLLKIADREEGRAEEATKQMKELALQRSEAQAEAFRARAAAEKISALLG
jgi:hypothetical protein